MPTPNPSPAAIGSLRDSASGGLPTDGADAASNKGPWRSRKNCFQDAGRRPLRSKVEPAKCAIAASTITVPSTPGRDTVWPTNWKNEKLGACPPVRIAPGR